MPLGFSGGANLVAMGERYGDKLAQGIERGGAIIEQALQRVTTQRQLEGLGQTMSQIDPKTPDYTQKLMEIAPQFPFAMKDPRGQAIFSMGVQAHKQWEQGEQAKQMFTNQQTIQGIRQRDALALQQARGQQSGNEMVDLTVPDRLTPQNPASGLSSPVAGVMAGAEENAPPPDETAQLMGMSGGLNDISSGLANPAVRAKQALQPLGPQASRKNLERLTIQNAASDDRKSLRTQEQTAIKERQEATLDLQREKLDLQQETAGVRRQISEEKMDFTKAQEKVKDFQRRRTDMMRTMEKSKAAGKIQEAEAQWGLVQSYDEAISSLLGINKTGEPSSGGGPVKVKTRAEADKLAPGTQFQTPDGRILIR